MFPAELLDVLSVDSLLYSGQRQNHLMSQLVDLLD